MTTDKMRQKIVATLLKRASKDFAGREKTLFCSFIEHFYGRGAPDDLLTDSEDTLYGIVRSYFELTLMRKRNTSSVRVFNPTIQKEGWTTRHTVIQLVNSDMPFLVNSVTGGLVNTRQLRLHMVNHPVIGVGRDAGGNLNKIYPHRNDDGAKKESYIYIEVDAISDPKELRALEAFVTDILDDIRNAVMDWQPMNEKLDEAVASLTICPPPIAPELTEELIEFLHWLSEDHFTFLGYREYRFDGDPKDAEFQLVEDSGLGILGDPKRFVLRGSEGLTSISAEIRHFLTLPDPMIITKANVKSLVHRQVHMDYIGVKMFNKKGQVVGERRFVGLFTSLSYSRSLSEVPMLRVKVNNTIERAPFSNEGHAGKALTHILETYPRDELFQISERELYDIVMDIRQLTERPRPRAFIRKDKFERFISALVYVPRESYHSDVREAITKILCESYGGVLSVYTAHMGQETLARWHFIIRTTPGAVGKPKVTDVNAEIDEASRGWTDRLLNVLSDDFGDEEANRLVREYGKRFSLAYQEAFGPCFTKLDIAMLEELQGADDIKVGFYNRDGDDADEYHLKIVHGQRLVALSDCLPMLEHLGFKVIGEYAYELSGNDGGCIHDFTLQRKGDFSYPLADVKQLIERLLLRVWHGLVEDDGFNALVLVAGMGWRQIVILRALAKYLRQIGQPFSMNYVETCLVENSEIAVLLVALFDARFNPALKGNRTAIQREIVTQIDAKLEQVSSLDQDRILRNYLNVIEATLRTNFYQTGVLEGLDERALAFKISSGMLEEAPLPRPHVEIFVFSPRLEGVHLRNGPVARGGLRWSDRREDFRTEVLGLVKAQQVKNAVIVPQGSKGGFYPKRLPSMSDREAFMAEGVASYRSFITSLISLTDNLDGSKVVHPKEMVLHDGDDPYLVVAADKGTATFSDIANGIADDNGFWLSDAFASGGSIGYDHKKMGITARGAWVSVQRHFRELGVNVQKDPVSVIGVGDMAGDVFGNGMLLSKTIELKAAFNHMHIFLDPNPKDGVVNWSERQRLFKKPRSSWSDYNIKLISKGGGIFERSAKSIPLSAEVKEWLGIEENRLAPHELIKLIMQAEADLLWFGGIGTYVRASSESNADVGDKANDLLRVRGKDLRVKAVGEGGNLGMTQLGRIEFARRGGRLNTDAIDNSAGVDCSDKEVNIKILLAAALAKKKITRKERESILSSMTKEVGEIVLTDNYLQTQAISLAESQADDNREYHHGLIRTLERDGQLDREIEYLPSDEKFAELAANSQGLTRPEIATLMSYAKISLFNVLMGSSILDDPIFKPELEWGFPTYLRENFASEMNTHRLKREIIATVLSNAVINWAGLSFVYEVKEETGLAVDDIVAAFVVVREVYNLANVWEKINAQDYKTPAGTQMHMHNKVSEFLKHQVLWILRNVPQPFNISETIERFSEPVAALNSGPASVLSKPAHKVFKQAIDTMASRGASKKLAREVASLEAINQAPDIISVSENVAMPVGDVATTYFTVGEKLGLEWLRQRALGLQPDDHWDFLAVAAEVEEIADLQRMTAEQVLGAGTGNASVKLKKWLKDNQTRLIRADRLMAELSSSGAITVAKLSFASRRLRAILR